jgi:hypothetical protein
MVIRTVGLVVGTGRGGIDRPPEVAASIAEDKAALWVTEDADALGQGDEASTPARGPDVSHDSTSIGAKDQRRMIGSRLTCNYAAYAPPNHCGR